MSDQEIILEPHNYKHPAFRLKNDDGDEININLPLFK